MNISAIVLAICLVRSVFLCMKLFFLPTQINFCGKILVAICCCTSKNGVSCQKQGSGSKLLNALRPSSSSLVNQPQNQIQDPIKGDDSMQQNVFVYYPSDSGHKHHHHHHHYYDYYTSTTTDKYDGWDWRRRK